ncbi:hypothetical protein JCM16814_29460 [Desulfobaculum senezii]|jgi:hypothetical protein|uniref:hypothetical protein n=1 Tax=Desulfobaculum sp. SPO524 TaxID=3378071 RepID=UPI0038540ED0
MSDCLRLLDQALDLGQQELDSLAVGDVDTTGDLANERGRLIEKAWSCKDDDGVDVNVLFTKLRRLRSLQGQLTTEAKRLHASLRDDIARIKDEGRRMKGYGNSTKVTPLFQSRLISKRG